MGKQPDQLPKGSRNKKGSPVRAMKKIAEIQAIQKQWFSELGWTFLAGARDAGNETWNGPKKKSRNKKTHPPVWFPLFGNPLPVPSQHPDLVIPGRQQVFHWLGRQGADIQHPHFRSSGWAKKSETMFVCPSHSAGPNLNSLRSSGR